MTFIHPFEHGMNKTTLQNRVSTPYNRSSMVEPIIRLQSQLLGTPDYSIPIP